MGVPGRPLSVRRAVLTYTQVFDLRIPSGCATPWVYTSSGFAYAFLLCNALGIHEFSICVYLADLGIRKSLVYVYLRGLCIPNFALARACHRYASFLPAGT